MLKKKILINHANKILKLFRVSADIFINYTKVCFIIYAYNFISYTNLTIFYFIPLTNIFCGYLMLQVTPFSIIF